MDLTVLYTLGVLSALHLLLVAYTGKSINRSGTTDPKKDPRAFKIEVLMSVLFIAVALLVWFGHWLFRF